MTNYLDTIALNLSQETAAGQTRNQVLSAMPWEPTPTTKVAYVSSNRVLIIADLEQAQQIEARLGERLAVFIAVPGTKNSEAITSNTWNVGNINLAGYLGRFTVQLAETATADGDPDNTNLGKILGIQNGLFDHIIDASHKPLLSAAIKPPGYYYVTGDSRALDHAIAEIPELIGEFEKPRFFQYDANICAHGRSGIKGCTRCIDACPTDAIISIGEQIEINKHLCQGGGTCASSCPSGAITYRYPRAEEQIEFLRQVTRSLREATSNRGITLLVYDSEHGADLIQTPATSLPEHILPLELEEIGSGGLDLFASALAYGANKVFVFAPPSVSEQVHESLERDIELLQSLFRDLDLSQYEITLVRELTAIHKTQPEPLALNTVATYAGIGNKRAIIRSAFQFFNEIAAKSLDTVALPRGSIFGGLSFDTDACTLCMGCVSVCPGSALEAGGESPALKFIESNCLQCGICIAACPESVLQLDPRFLFDHVAANRASVLKEEEAFRCLKCNKPFATQAMINRMTDKLKGHWMFDTPDALNRLKMCEDCRVSDMFDQKDTVM